MIRTVNSIAVVILLSLAGATLHAQTTDQPDARFAQTQVEAIPIGATVTLRTRDGERFKAVLFSMDETGIRVKPASRVPEPSRRLTYGQIERIKREEDHVSVGKYAGIGSAIGAAVLLLLLAGV